MADMHGKVSLAEKDVRITVYFFFSFFNYFPLNLILKDVVDLKKGSWKLLAFIDPIIELKK